MAMARKDYQLVARALRSQREAVITRSSIQCSIIDETAECLAANFALMNENFKKDAFLEAAGHGESNND